MAEDGTKILNIIRSLKGEIKSLKEDLKDIDKLMPNVGGGKGSSGNGNVSTSKTPPYPSVPSAPGAPVSPGAPAAPTVTPGGIGASARGGTGWGTTLAGIGLNAAKGAFEVAVAAASFLPTGQEAIGVQQLSDRIKFYGNSNGRSMQRYAAQTGTSTSPLDAAFASNAAMDAGLLPGLKNFGGGNKNSPFTGVMGSAALASNLAPGLGITGGAAVVGAINAPQNVNMLRAFGINARPGSGGSPADLASIIDQLYNILKESGPVTKENIAISAMPGNALDSILNQYFGGDPNVKNVIISGLIQKASSLKDKKGNILSLYQSGSQANLMKTGGLSTGNVSVARRNASELGMITNNTDSTIKGLVGANNGLQSLYDFMGSKAGNSFVSGGQQLGIALETLGGARGGAGAQLMNTLMANKGLVGLAAVGTVLGKSFKGAKDLFGGEQSLSNLNPIANFGKSLANFGNSPQAVGGGAYSNTAATGSGNTFTGGININLQLAPGQDPYSVGSALTQQMQWGMFN